MLKYGNECVQWDRIWERIAIVLVLAKSIEEALLFKQGFSRFRWRKVLLIFICFFCNCMLPSIGLS
jgi:arginine exporter protein ArgO